MSEGASSRYLHAESYCEYGHRILATQDTLLNVTFRIALSIEPLFVRYGSLHHYPRDDSPRLNPSRAGLGEIVPWYLQRIEQGDGGHPSLNFHNKNIESRVFEDPNAVESQMMIQS